MGVLKPLKLVITNYPEGQTEMLEIENNAKDETKGTRLVPFLKRIIHRTRRLYGRTC